MPHTSVVVNPEGRYNTPQATQRKPPIGSLSPALLSVRGSICTLIHKSPEYPPGGCRRRGNSAPRTLPPRGRCAPRKEVCSLAGATKGICIVAGQHGDSTCDTDGR